MLPVLNLYLASFFHAMFDIFSRSQINIVTKSYELLQKLRPRIDLLQNNTLEKLILQKIIQLLLLNLKINHRKATEDVRKKEAFVKLWLNL